MLRKFKISIDGTQYLVEMEEIGAPQPTATDSLAAPAAPAPAAAVTPAGAHEQAAPMPGKILDILVNTGDAVAVNQPVIILEAMKMESQIVAEQAGTIASVNVEKGAMVNPGDPLFSIA